MAGVLLVALSIALGLAAVFPARHAVGAFGYAVASLPIGLLTWSAGPALTNLMGWRLSAPTAIASALAATVLMGLAFRRATPPSNADARFDLAPATIWSAILLVLAAVVTTSGATAISWDSVFSYSTWGVWLADTGAFADVMLGTRSTLIPSLIATERLLGGGWQSALYPVLAAGLLGTLAYAVLATGPGSRQGRRTGALIAAALLAIATPFVFHAFYVHSHVLEAVYLLLALVSIERARAEETSAPWLLLAGLATAGFTLGRPDAVAYASVPVIAALLATLTAPAGRRQLAWFTGGFLMPVIVVLASAFATLGLWTLEGEGLEGGPLLALLAAYVVLLGGGIAVAGSSAAQTIARWAAPMLALGTVLAVVVAVALDRTSAALAVRNGFTNALAEGGYGTFWLFAFGLGVLVLAVPRLRAERQFVRLLGLIGLFVAVGLVVHATAHPGRLGWNDSLMRVLFHIVPVVMWLYGAVFAHVWTGETLEDHGAATEMGRLTADR